MKDSNSNPNTPPRSADEIYFAAFEIEDEQKRRAYVEQVCAEDERLQQEVLKLFGMQDEADHLFRNGSPTQITAVDVANTLTHIPEFFENMKTSLPDDEEVGKQIGPYKLLQKIGEGGVGMVYLAKQVKPVRRQVALKIIKAGMDTKNVIARFEAERQALAMMEHPNIARVLNAGETETGRPFFVMELVDGERITTYCNENKLSIRRRLELFIQVCHAIQHAHQKGIIHRDIKPSNVLITQYGGTERPVVIDFGIAKATTEELLTEKTVNTLMGPLLGTPAYMSPEQTNLAQIDIDTRSDIYSLGVLLYELLTGKTPFDQKELLRSGIDEMTRILRTVDPPLPSAGFHALDAETQENTAQERGTESRKLYTLLTRDLDWIVMKSMEKDRRRRYETVDALAMDIENFLNDEPVAATPPSRMYRLQKLVRRNKTTFAYLTAVALALIAGFGTSTWFLIKERQARKRAIIAEQQQTHLRIAAEDRERIAHAAFMIGQGRMEAADEAVNEVSTELMPSLEVESVLRTLGEWHVLHGRWNEAAERFSSLLKVDVMDDSWAITADLLMAGPVLIEKGSTEEYEEFRRAAIARYLDTADWNAAERTLKISLLLPADEAMLQKLKPFSDLAIKYTDVPPTETMAAWRCISLGLFAYRNSDPQAAIVWSLRAREFRTDATARVATSHVIQAMALCALNDRDSAETQLHLGRELIDNTFSAGLEIGDGLAGFWYDWLFARILLREADALLSVDQ
ncbi:MAG: serine/threonine protein kinase [Pontiellaceae bacterium]|nr:serine/threonine protein kinase [Pontiellaceae bacterium]